MKDINEIMPKIKGMRWGAVTNTSPTIAKFNEINRILPHDGKWHTIFEEPELVHIDGIAVRRKLADSMT